MGEERNRSANSTSNAGANAEVRVTAGGRELDLLAFGVVLLVTTLAWLPTLTSGRRLNMDDDFFLYAARHEAVRQSVIQHRTFPLRSHWFGGGFPTLGEPEDPALNPLVLLSVLFGAVIGIKLIGFLAALASAMGTYALARYILRYTRWGALFSALIMATSLYVPQRMQGGNPNEVWPAYLPLCMLLLALSCRGRRAALFALPLLLYAMLSDGKQTFVVAVFYLGVLCLLGALPMFSTLSPELPGRRCSVRGLQVLVLALVVTFFIGMVRILAVLELMEAKGGLMGAEPFGHVGLKAAIGISWHQLWHFVPGVHGFADNVTVGWLPLILLAIAACCFWKRALPWVITTVLLSWLVLAEKAPVNLFRLLEGVPVFSAIGRPYKFFGFEIVLSIALGAGQFFWLLQRFRYRWLEHICAVVVIIVGVSFLYPKALADQRGTYTVEIEFEGWAPEPEFFNVQGLGLSRNRSEPPGAVGYLNVLQNVGTIDWYAAITLPENAVPRYFVDASNRGIRNPEYRGEAYFVEAGGRPGSTSPVHERTAETGSAEDAPAGYAAKSTFRPNSITVQVTVPKPGVLVINQNYHAAWRTDRGELFDRKGLIALRLRETGSYTIHLRYLPRSFVAGLAVSVLSLAGWVLACWTFLGRRLQRWGKGDMSRAPLSTKAQ